MIKISVSKDKNKNITFKEINSPLIEIKYKDRKITFVGEIYYLKKYKTEKFSATLNFKKKLKKILNKETLINIPNLIEGNYYFIIKYNNGDFDIGRNQTGEKELFYFKSKNKIIISDSLEPIIKNLKNSQISIYNNQAIFNILTVYGNYSFKKETIYKNIKRLGVNEFIKVTKLKINIIKKKFIPAKIKKFEENDLIHYYTNLENSVKVRSSSSINWILMSSGWDSSGILSILNKLYGNKKIRAVIGRVKYSDKWGIVNKPEIDRAKKICKYFNIQLEVIDIDYTSKNFIYSFNKFKSFMRSNHLYSIHGYIYFKLSEYIYKNKKNNKDAIFNGDISDGAHNFGFAQYANFLQFEDLGFREYVDKMFTYLYGPSFFKKVQKKNFNKDTIYNFLKKNRDITFENIKSKFNYLAPLFLGKDRVPFEKLITSDLIKKNKKKIYINNLKKNYFNKIIEDFSYKNIYSCIIFLYNSFHWQSSIVRSTLLSPSFFGMSSRTPYRDINFLNLLSSSPESWGRGLNLKETKFPLKYSLKNFVNYPSYLQTGPHSYLYDKDERWNALEDIIYHSNVKKYFKNNLRKIKIENIFDSNFFDIKRIKRLKSRYLLNKKEKGKRLIEIYGLICISQIGIY